MAVLEAASEAEFAVLAEWHTWHPSYDKTTMNGFCFYCYLQRHRPHLLNFECRGDRWQVVHCWLIHARYVKN